jgi:subtilisin family serine protease
MRFSLRSRETAFGRVVSTSVLSALLLSLSFPAVLNTHAYAEEEQPSTSEQTLATESVDKDSVALSGLATLQAGTGYVDRELLVCLKADSLSSNGLSTESINSQEASYGDDILDDGTVTVVADGSWLDGDKYVKVTIPDGVSMEDAVDALASDDKVSDVELNTIFQLDSFNDAEAATYTAAVQDPETSNNDWYLNQIHAWGAWNYIESNSNVTVVVIDNGFDIYNEDLNGALARDKNGVCLAYNAYTKCLLKYSPNDGNAGAGTSHGTFVAGEACALADNGIGVTGVSYNAKVLPICIGNGDLSHSDTSLNNTLSWSGAVAAYDYILKLAAAKSGDVITIGDKTITCGGDDQKIKVVNMSWGNEVSDLSQLSKTTTFYSRIYKAVSLYNITLVSSAGNDNAETIQCPADYDECISVINVDSNNNRAQYTKLDGTAGGSSYGSLKDVAAPGMYILSTDLNNTYTKKSGTSMSSPIVAGAVALMYAADPDITPAQVRTALITTASHSTLTTSSQTPIFDTYTAYGTINAEDAVEYVLFGTNLTDVDTSSWYVKGGYLTYVAQNDLMKGYAGTHLFAPESTISRGQLATILYRLACQSNSSLISTYGSTTDSSRYATTSVFTDEAANTYYTAAINWAHAVGILTGDSSTNYTTVRPDDSSSRQETSVMAYRYALNVKYLTIDTSSLSTPNVNDWSLVASWATDAVKWTCSKNVIGLYDNGDGTYSTLATSAATRSQFAKVVTNLSKTSN